MILDAVAAGTDFGQCRVNTVLIYCTQRYVGEAQANPAIFALNPESAMLQIRQKTPFGLVVSVGNMVASHGFLAGDFTYSCHDDILQNSGNAYYIPVSKIFSNQISPRSANDMAVPPPTIK